MGNGGGEPSACRKREGRSGTVGCCGASVGFERGGRAGICGFMTAASPVVARPSSFDSGRPAAAFSW